MAHDLDTKRWVRRAAYEHFRDFEQPFFSVCSRVDVAPLKAALAQRPGLRLSLACHHLALRLANEQPPFLLRLLGHGGLARVRMHDSVDASITVLRADESFGFAHLPWRAGLADFSRQAAAAMQAVREGAPGFQDPVPAADDAVALMYFTTLPWLHFSSFTHARPGRADALNDSIPRVAFGRIDADGPRQWMPVALDVHHALMDGLHAGRWLQAFEEGLAAPHTWLDS
jgi:chloramphenicol O-acetyltransferase type A